jgi:hypothetical protein
MAVDHSCIFCQASLLHFPMVVNIQHSHLWARCPKGKRPTPISDVSITGRQDSERYLATSIVILTLAEALFARMAVVLRIVVAMA